VLQFLLWVLLPCDFPPQPKGALASLIFAAICGSAYAAPLTFTVLKPKNGWTAYGYDTRVAAAAVDNNDVVHLEGAIAQPTGSDPIAFILPAKFRPAAEVYITVDQYGGATGRLDIYADGTVHVQGIDYSLAQGFTSLEGVTFPKN
jgi:hypothetical protein